MGHVKGKTVRRRVFKFQTAENALNKEWKAITRDDYRKIVDEIPSRLQKVINNDVKQIKDG